MKGKISVLIGLMLMLVGLIWHAVTLREANRAAIEVQVLVPQVQQVISEQAPVATEPEAYKEQRDTMTETVIDGIGYVGVLKIPVLNLELPVISSWSDENGKIAPCRYSGTVFQNDLVLCAHNYRGHFGRLNQLKTGDRVEFHDMDGNAFSYQVQELQTLDGTDVDRIREGDWDLTLFTCTSGGKKRYIVRCVKES